MTLCPQPLHDRALALHLASRARILPAQSQPAAGAAWNMAGRRVALSRQRSPVPPRKGNSLVNGLPWRRGGVAGPKAVVETAGSAKESWKSIPGRPKSLILEKNRPTSPCANSTSRTDLSTSLFSGFDSLFIYISLFKSLKEKKEIGEKGAARQKNYRPRVGDKIPRVTEVACFLIHESHGGKSLIRGNSWKRFPLIIKSLGVLSALSTNPRVALPPVTPRCAV